MHQHFICFVLHYNCTLSMNFVFCFQSAAVTSVLVMDRDCEVPPGHNLGRRGSVSGMSQRIRTEERITLSVHGIREVGM
jgi:hypothetical protein